MKKSKNTQILAGILVVTLNGSVGYSQLYSIPTNLGNGADAEVRESNPTQNRGISTEIATRIQNLFPLGDPNDGSDRNSAIYTKFDISGVNYGALPAGWYSSFTLTYRNNNLVESRIYDGVSYAGLNIYALNTALTWDENTITYLNAPGITFDGNVGTKDFNSDLTLLGQVFFPAPGAAGHLLVGDSLVFSSAALDTFVAGALAGGKTEITLVAERMHEGDDSAAAAWRNFNYLFNPKEQTTLNADGDSPWSGADNSTGLFSPTLTIVPEPSTLALAALGAASLALRRGRR